MFYLRDHAINLEWQTSLSDSDDGGLIGEQAEEDDKDDEDPAEEGDDEESSDEGEQMPQGESGNRLEQVRDTQAYDDQN